MLLSLIFLSNLKRKLLPEDRGASCLFGELPAWGRRMGHSTAPHHTLLISARGSGWLCNLLTCSRGLRTGSLQHRNPSTGWIPRLLQVPILWECWTSDLSLPGQVVHSTGVAADFGPSRLASLDDGIAVRECLVGVRCLDS